MKIVQYGEKVTWEECNMEIAKHEKSATWASITWKECNIEKSATQKEYKTERMKHEKSAVCRKNEK